MRTHRRIRWDAVCPSCGSLERHRAFIEYLKDVDLEGKLVLDVAPMNRFRELFEGRGASYISTDIASDCMVRASLLKAPFADGTFDIVICYHVLEHIKEDRLAMTELARITKPDGRLYVQVPMDPDTECTVEYPAADPYNHFHVRDYGLDFEDRLAGAGLECARLDIGGNIEYGRRVRIGAVKAVGITHHCKVPGN